MSDELQHELDDELLSAYLDDELSAEERALVERRLADDPAARQMLDQLRHASQAVRELPPLTVPHDMRESILTRIESGVPRPRLGVGVQMPTDDMPTQSRGHATLPTVTIGRTRRGWVWASLAVAAALLIMVMQSGDGPEPNVADVAQRNSERAAEEGTPLGDVADLPTVNAPASPESISGREAIDESAPVARDLAESAPASVPAAPTGESSSVSGSPTTDHFASSTRSESVELQLEGGAFDSGSAPEPQPSDEEEPLVVVHVLAKRSALESKTFDRLLAENGIAVEPDQPADASALEPPSEDSQEKPASGVGVDASGQLGAIQDAEVDFVLVDAPEQAIMACMAELNKDSANYLGVSVEESPASEEALTNESLSAKKVATDFGRFNRGMVSPEQKDSVSGDKFYYQLETSDGAARGSRSLGGGRGGVAGAKVKELELQSLARKSEMDRGRARRVQQWNVEGRRSGEYRFATPADEAPAAKLDKQRGQAREAKTLSSAENERLQVLFVLRPEDESASSPAAASRAE